MPSTLSHPALVSSSVSFVFYSLETSFCSQIGFLFLFIFFKVVYYKKLSIKMYEKTFLLLYMFTLLASQALIKCLLYGNTFARSAKMDTTSESRVFYHFGFSSLHTVIKITLFYNVIIYRKLHALYCEYKVQSFIATLVQKVNLILHDPNFLYSCNKFQ